MSMTWSVRAEAEDPLVAFLLETFYPDNRSPTIHSLCDRQRVPGLVRDPREPKVSSSEAVASLACSAGFVEGSDQVTSVSHREPLATTRNLFTSERSPDAACRSEQEPSRGAPGIYLGCRHRHHADLPPPVPLVTFPPNSPSCL